METKAHDWDELMKYRTAKPFRPFFIDLRSGEVLQVLDAMWFGGIDDRLSVYDPAKPELLRHRVSEIVSIRHMTSDETSQRTHLLRKKRV